MTFAIWEPRFSVGVTELDAQHRNLFDLINDYHECARRGLAQEAATRTLDALVQYARYHFSYEEKLMRKYGYTGVPAQVAAHQELIDTLLDFQSRQTDGTAPKPLEVSEFVRRWLTDHILLVDMLYVDCFRKIGVA